LGVPEQNLSAVTVAAVEVDAVHRGVPTPPAPRFSPSGTPLEPSYR
jgi:hypothetical protein